MLQTDNSTVAGTRRIRVLKVIDTLRGGGVENLLLNIVPHLDDAGIDLSVLHLHNEPDLVPALRAMGVPTEGLCPGRFRWFRTSRAERTERDAKALSFGSEWAPDVVHTHLEASYLYGPWLAEQLRVPVVHTVHSARAPWQIERSPRIALLRSLILRRFSRSQRVLCVGQGVADFLAELMPRAAHRLEVLENCVGDAFAAPIAAAEPEFDVAIVGRMGPEKNQAYALQALARVRERVPALSVGFVGFGAEDANLRGLCRDLQLDDAVRFLGRLDTPEVISVLDRSRAFTMPSRFEGFGISAAEALFRGLPCVLSDIDVFRKLFGGRKGVWLAPLDNVNAYAAALEQALAAPRRDHRAFLERFSPQLHVAHLRAVYDDAVSKEAA